MYGQEQKNVTYSMLYMEWIWISELKGEEFRRKIIHAQIHI
jgi:hypothetical protein